MVQYCSHNKIFTFNCSKGHQGRKHVIKVLQKYHTRYEIHVRVNMFFTDLPCSSFFENTQLTNYSTTELSSDLVQRHIIFLLLEKLTTAGDTYMYVYIYTCMYYINHTGCIP